MCQTVADKPLWDSVPGYYSLGISKAGTATEGTGIEMTANDTYIAEDGLISSAVLHVYAENAAQALDKALNQLDRIAANTGRVACIETYTAHREADDFYTVSFS